MMYRCQAHPIGSVSSTGSHKGQDIENISLIPLLKDHIHWPVHSSLPPFYKFVYNAGIYKGVVGMLREIYG